MHGLAWPPPALPELPVPVGDARPLPSLLEPEQNDRWGVLIIIKNFKMTAEHSTQNGALLNRGPVCECTDHPPMNASPGPSLMLLGRERRGRRGGMPRSFTRKALTHCGSLLPSSSGSGGAWPLNLTQPLNS